MNEDEISAAAAAAAEAAERRSAYEEVHNLAIGNVFLGDFVVEQDEWNFAQFIADFPVTSTTLTQLTIRSPEVYEPTTDHIRTMVDPLCRCIANLQNSHEGNHPLQTLCLADFSLSLEQEQPDDGQEERLAVFVKFLLAAKLGGIRHLTLCGVYSGLPVEMLVALCRDNTTLQTLDLTHVTFCTYTTPNDDTSSSGSTIGGIPLMANSHLIHLEQLVLNHVTFEDATAADAFTNHFAAHIGVYDLVLGPINVHLFWNNELQDDTEFSNRLVTQLIQPSLEVLEFKHACELKHFQAALEAGTAWVMNLIVYLDSNPSDKTAKFNALANFVRDATELKLLALQGHQNGDDAIAYPPFFHALDYCYTITEIQMNENVQSNFSPKELQHLERVTSRNVALEHWIASPVTYPHDQLLTLMRQFDPCPTGRYLLARGLPEMFNFQKGHSLFPPPPCPISSTEPTPKKRKHQDT